MSSYRVILFQRYEGDQRLIFFNDIYVQSKIFQHFFLWIPDEIPSFSFQTDSTYRHDFFGDNNHFQ